jgi:tripartite ATP-independent transporter DctM subunit
MMLVGLIGSMIIGGKDLALDLIGMVPFSNTANYTMAAIPMFILMGVILSVGGIGSDLYDSASRWIGQVRGGLAMATVVACGFFAAVCGDSTATGVTMGKVAFPEMKRYGYADKLAASCISAGGTIGILIPPSIGFIIYGLITEQSIGALFMAGLVPGILQVIFYCIAIAVYCRINPSVGPAGPKSTMKEKFGATYKVIPTLLIFLFIIGGLYGGLFTPTAGGAMGAFFSLIVCIVMRRMTWNKFAFAVRDTAKSTAMVFFLIIGAYVFMRFMSLNMIPTTLGNTIAGLYHDYNVPRFAIMAMIIVMYLIVGAFLDFLAAELLTLPIIYPIIVSLGYDPIWWGVIMVRMREISMITPPYGLNLFVLSRTLKTPISTLYKGVWPFIVSDILHVGMLMAFPGIALLFQ